jgi:hypothetical protein
MTPKIFIYCVPNAGLHPSDVVGYAIAEDGSSLKAHMSSSLEWFRRDMGIAPPFFDLQHYTNHYPDGYELIDLTQLTEEQLHDHPELNAALTKNKEIPSDDPTQQ